MTKILVTGATGFLGKELCLFLLKEGFEVRGTYRKFYPKEIEFHSIDWVQIPSLSPAEIWDNILDGCHIVIHAAARVHQMNASLNDEREFYNENVLGTKSIVEAIIRNTCVKQFIFISSILVYGKNQSMPLNKNSICYPDTIYGKSKLEAEFAVINTLKNSNCHWTILRPTVMYGSENKGNIASLTKLIHKNIPIPIQNLKNRRSFLSVENMCLFIYSTIMNEDMKNKIFCVADATPISTKQFMQALAQIKNTNVRFIFVPKILLFTAAKICDLFQKFGIKLPWNSEIYSKIFDDYWIDMKLNEKNMN